MTQPTSKRLLTEAAGNTAYAGISTRAARPSNTIIWMGDSLSAYSAGVSTATPVQPFDPAILDGKGIHNWANFFLGKDLSVLGNSGIGGQTTADMLARFTTDVLAYNPAMVSILAGTNDPLAMDTIGNLTAMYTAALNAGIRVIAQTVPPQTTPSYTGVEARRLKINQWLRDYARNTPGIILSDMAAAWQDPTLAGYKPVVAYVNDGTHPTVAGAMVAGRVFADAVRPFVPRNRVRAAAAIAPYNLLGNPHFLGTIVNVNPTNNNLGAWAIQGADLTLTPMDRTDGYAGRMLEVVVPAGGSANLTTNVDVGANLAVGDLIDFGAEIEIVTMETNPANTKLVKATMQQYNGSAFGDQAFELYSDAGATYGTGWPIPAGSYGVRTNPKAIATGRILAQGVIGLAGGGTYRIKGGFMRNLTGIAAA